MKNKTLIRMTVSIPEYIYKIIEKIHEDYPSTTMNGTMNAIIEKGAYWYRKKMKAAKEEMQQSSEGGRPDTQAVDHEQQHHTKKNDELTGEELDKEVNRILEELYGKRNK